MAKKSSPPPPTYEGVVLEVLANESTPSEQAKLKDLFKERKITPLAEIDPLKESEAKIRDRLQRKKLGPYDAQRVARARDLKNDLREEVAKGDQSSYLSRLKPSKHAKVVAVLNSLSVAASLIPFAVISIGKVMGFAPIQTILAIAIGAAASLAVGWVATRDPKKDQQ